MNDPRNQNNTDTLSEERVKQLNLDEDFDGKTYNRGLDHTRLSTLLERVHAVMSDGEWHRLSELAGRCGGSECSVSARIRDLRKEKFGAHHIISERVRDGIWQYRLVL